MRVILVCFSHRDGQSNKILIYYKSYIYINDFGNNFSNEIIFVKVTYNNQIERYEAH